MRLTLSLRARLMALFAVLLVAGFAGGISVLALSAGPRVRAEAESVTRLSREFVETALSGLRQSADAGPALDRLLADFANLRHVRIYLDESGAPSPRVAERRAPDWFERLADARPTLTRIPLDLPGREGAAIVIETSPQDEVAEIRDDFWRLALGGAALSVGAFALMGYLVTRSLRPVAAISDGLERLERGGYDVTLAQKGPADFVGMAQRLNALSNRLAALARENRGLGQRIVHVQDDERREIARNLHDEFGPSLFAIRAGLAALVRKAEAGPLDAAGLVAILRPVSEQVEALQQINRRILGQLRPPALGEFGLVGALRALIENLRQSAPHLEASLDVSGDVDALDETIALTAYRIVQEALTNIARHAGATRAEIRVRRRGLTLSVRVVDNGDGFDPTTPRGLGLKGMSERVEALGGALTLDIDKSGGVLVAADLPLAPD